LVHITKLELFGFKSFGFKNTIVDFEPGLVSISGPNGSGKSNILDGIMFALGENRPKIMRVDKLKSLIHDIEGANRRGPKMVRASVHFDNSERKIPVDSDNVEVTREMDDRGENIYYLNKKKTTRSNILDLLEVANSGIHQLNIVQQGTVTRISEFSPEEKRIAIEDLVGLSYFDDKKSEALNQLEEADRRLDIALAKMGEIKTQIDNLEEERNQKLRHDMVENELRRLNAITLVNQLKTLRVDKTSKERNVHALQSEIKKFDENRSGLKKGIYELESQKSKLMAEADAYTREKARIESELSQAMHLFEETKSEMSTSAKRLGYIDVRLPQIIEEFEQIHTSSSSLETQLTPLKESIQKVNTERRILNEELKSINSELKKILMQQSHVANHKNEIDKKIKKLNDKLTSAKIYYGNIVSEISNIQNKINSNSTKNNDYFEEIKKLAMLKLKLESIILNHKNAINELKSRISKFENKKSKIEKDLDELTLILEKSTKASTQYEEKIKLVKSIMHEDYSIAKLKEDSNKLGIEGLVYEMISWDKKYERAILAVSSDWIKAIVVKDFVTLTSLAETAKTKKLPRLKIIPVEAIPELHLTLPDRKGVLGTLSDYVTCDEKYNALKTFLFGNVILVDSKNSALELSKFGYKAVTLEGEFFDAKSSAAVIDINSKISKLTKIISMSSSIEGLTQSIHLLKNFTQKKKFALKNIDKIIQNYKKRLSISETGFATTGQSYGDLKSQINSADQTKIKLISRIEQLEKRKVHLTGEVAKQESYVLSLDERISLVRDNYSDYEQTRIANELSKLNEKKATVETKLGEIESGFREKTNQMVNLNANESELKLKSKSIHDEKSSLNSEKHDLEVRLRTLEKENSMANEQLVNLRDNEQSLISTSGTSVTKIKEFDDKLRELNESERSVTKEINGIERQSDSLERDLKDLTDKESKIQKNLEMFGYDENIEAFDVEPILQALYSEQRSLSSSLNARAPQTYVEISTRYRSMSTRKNDLEGERNSIVNFIDGIEKEKRQTFLDAFDKVDKEIRIAFSKMTGGNAWLELQNEDDIFSTGISYLVQFPTKPKRESTSISGGEKTLAAIVFVLALQKLKSSSFYLFDEIDAHLDAPNAERLAKIIEERSEGSQFIMVSLKDSVVKKAKLIYGVYPKNGVSHVVVYKDNRLPSMMS